MTLIQTVSLFTVQSGAYKFLDLCSTVAQCSTDNNRFRYLLVLIKMSTSLDECDSNWGYNTDNAIVLGVVLAVWIIGVLAVIGHENKRGERYVADLPYFSRKCDSSLTDFLLLGYEFLTLISFSLLKQCLFDISPSTETFLSIPTLFFGSSVTFWIVSVCGIITSYLLVHYDNLLVDTVYDMGDEDWMEEDEVNLAVNFYWLFKRADMLFLPFPSFFLSYMACQTDGHNLKLTDTVCWEGAEAIIYGFFGGVFFLISYGTLMYLMFTTEER